MCKTPTSFPKQSLLKKYINEEKNVFYNLYFIIFTPLCVCTHGVHWLRRLWKYSILGSGWTLDPGPYLDWSGLWTCRQYRKKIRKFKHLTKISIVKISIVLLVQVSCRVVRPPCYFHIDSDFWHPLPHHIRIYRPLHFASQRKENMANHLSIFSLWVSSILGKRWTFDLCFLSLYVAAKGLEGKPLKKKTI